VSEKVLWCQLDRHDSGLRCLTQRTIADTVASRN
jgi:hypothetical protein